MNDYVPPPEDKYMGAGAQERARRNYGAREQQARITSIGPRELGPGDGLREPNAWSGAIEGRKWVVNGLIPAAQVTMITGNGGEGKSLIAAQLACAAATGSLWLGNRVDRIRSLMVHCEDDELEMRRRIDGIVNAEGFTTADLDMLQMLDRDGAETSLLYEAQGNETTGRFTEFHARLHATIQSLGSQLLILDSLYNFFGGNENIRSQVSEFIGGLKRLAKQLNCAIVIVAHPGRAGMGVGGDGTSGSTAWHNAVRSRFYLHRKRHPSGDPEKKGPLMFEHVKANYGAPVVPVELFWEAGRFVPVCDPQMPINDGWQGR